MEQFSFFPAGRLILLLAVCVANALPASAEGSQQTPEVVGRVELVDFALVPAKDAGIVKKLLVKPGASVKAGELLAQLDEEPFLAQLEVSDRQLQIAELESKNDIDYLFAVKSQEVSQKVLERSENANTVFDKSISLTEIDRLRLEMEKSELSAEQAEHTLAVNQKNLEVRIAERNLAKQKLDDRRITSPISGVVVQQLVQPGEFLQPGQAAFRIISLDRLRAAFRLPDSAIGGLGPGSLVRISSERNGLAGAVEGRIVFISPETDSVQRDVLVWAEFDNSTAALRPGEPCRVGVVTDEN